MSSGSTGKGGGTRARAARLAPTGEPAAKRPGSKPARSKGSGTDAPGSKGAAPGSKVPRSEVADAGSAAGSSPEAGATGSDARAGGARATGDRRTGVAKGPKAPSEAEAARLAALGEERDFLLGSLRDLEAEHEAGDVDDRDFAALADDYTARAAAVIRAMDRPPARRSAATPERSLTRRILVGALVAIFAVGAGVVVAQWSGQRGSGDSITGGVRGDTRDDLLAARQEAADGQYLEAIKGYDKVLQLDPANTEALAYRGWMLRIVATSASGQQRSQLQAEALASLQQALRTDPTDGSSLVFMAVLLGDLGRPQDALAELAKVPAGQIPSAMTSTIGQFKAQMEAQLPASGSTTSTAAAAATTTTS